jgi:lipoprotein-releasing system ATP-binding protein
MNNIVLQCSALDKTYRDGNRSVTVLQNLDLSLLAGEKIAIVGSSGSGKSTLLNLLGGLDTPSAGEVLMAGENMALLSEKQRCRLRNKELGFVYQFHHLLPEFDARENVAMPLLIGGMGRAQAMQRAAEMLARVGLEGRLTHRPGQLSGGERQRVAIARALVTRPGCVLMDEPTGNLDPQSAAQVLSLIDELRRDKASFVVVTHDPVIARNMDRTLELRDGRLQEMSL